MLQTTHVDAADQSRDGVPKQTTAAPLQTQQTVSFTTNSQNLYKNDNNKPKVPYVDSLFLTVAGWQQ